MILHIDGDAFFASCEVSLNPKLKGKPVVTGLEKGIASSMSYEAKRRGVTRAMPIFQIRNVCPEALIIPSHFNTYTTFSRRMFSIVRRYADVVEEYSIDECFADISKYGDDPAVLREIGKKIKEDIFRELAITVSLGISLSKVLAKVASKANKPDGLICITKNMIETFLSRTPIGRVWGIGASTSVVLNKLGIFNALEFIQKNHSWVLEHLSKPYSEIWHELKGIPMHKVHDGAISKHKSIMKTRMFKPPSADPAFIFSELSKNIENACIKARHCGLVSREVSLYLKTQAFGYHAHSIKMIKPSNTPHEIVSFARKSFSRMYKPHTLYRATGVILRGMSDDSVIQADLFDEYREQAKIDTLYDAVDRIDEKYGKHTVFLASSLRSIARHNVQAIPRVLPLPCMGEVF